MTTTRRQALIFVAFTAVLLAATATRVLATTYYIFRNPDGSLKRVAGQDEEWQKWGDQEMDCRTGTCNPCGDCHKSAATLTGKRIASTTHSTAYAKAAVRLAPGQRIGWGPYASLVFERDRLCLFSTRNEKLLCYDPTSILLKDRSGQPAYVSSTRPPTLFAVKSR